jgi:hypothetical protein
MQMALNIVPATAKRRIAENCSKMVDKKPIGHELTGIQSVATYRRSRWLTREETTRRCLSHIQNAPDDESDDDYNTF